MFIFQYSKQELHIKLRQSTFISVSVSNGVWQGGMFSLRLFVVYFDDLLKQLSHATLECFIKHESLNHVMHADDICHFTYVFIIKAYLCCV